MTKPEIVTFGCRLNAFESEVIRVHAEAACLDDAIIINTCAVTSEAERQARQTIRKLHRENPESRIIVTGCAAQVNGDAFAGMDEVDVVLGNEEKLLAESYLNLPAEGGVLISDIMQASETSGHLIKGFDARTRAFVQIQQGCDHRCTFCIIPFGRGNSRSVPMGFLANQMSELVDAGYNEFVLTGVDISSYGSDLPGQPSLGELCRRLLNSVSGLERLRLSSLDPAVVDEDLIRLINEDERLMPHLHLSVQAGSDMILKRMKRRHNRRDVIELCDRLRTARTDLIFGADIITGFPTETEEMFSDTLDLVDEAGLTYLHVFPYSPRPGTPAARMPQMPDKDRRERAKRLRERGEQAKSVYFDTLIGSTARMLSEADNRGHTDHYAPVQLETPITPGSVLPVKITGRTGAGLTAALVA
jgi:threonylcarbamoyladenosine tRNA methylthiotransferase MtaB